MARRARRFMQIQSLGHQTSLALARFEGEVVERADYLVIRTPTNPTYRWGNYLLFREPPVAGDSERWPALFQDEMADIPDALEHRTFTWDRAAGPCSEVDAFVSAGYTIETASVLTASEVAPAPRPNTTATMRALRSDDDWEQAIRNQIVSTVGEDADAEFRTFKERSMRSYRAMVNAGRGDWFGAFEGELLVADLGLFVDRRLGRYQRVCTAPEHRRRGLCGTLVSVAAQAAFERHGAESLVIVAEKGSQAAGVYTSLGFREVEQVTEIARW